MKGIMFNDHFGLEIETIDGKKTRTSRKVRLPKTYNGINVCGFNKYANDLGWWCTYLYDEDERDIDNSEVPFQYEEGEIVAIKQSYKTIWENMMDGPEKDDFKTKHENLAGWKNKMFTKNEEMVHQIMITDVTLEHIQDISKEDCIKEGIISSFCDNPGVMQYFIPYHFPSYPTEKEAFGRLIDEISGKGTWDKNEWVTVYYYKLIK